MKIKLLARKSKFDVKRSFYTKSKSIFLLLGCYWSREGHVYRGITYSTTDIQRRYISVVVTDLLEKTIDAILNLSGMLVMVKYLFLKFKKRIESELKKRI
jgi:nitrogen regulatory protein P-II 1